uniref:Major sperm protein n=1 Tax=Plectus sambesii TaxID=2011161 RepID=A0A914V1N5_9BILA
MSSKEKVQAAKPPLAAMSGRLIGVSLAPVAVVDIELEEPHLNVAIKPRQLEFPRYPLNSKPPTKRLTIINNGPTPVAFKLLTSDNISYGVSSKFGIVAGRTTGKSRRVDVRIFRKPPDPRSGDAGDKPIKNHLQVLVTELQDPQLTAELAFRQPDLKFDRYKIHLLYTAIPAPAPSHSTPRDDAVKNVK